MFWNKVRNGPSRSSKVVEFGTNRKRLYDFLLVMVTLVLSSPVSEILQVFCWEERPHPIPSEFWGRSAWTRLLMLWLRGAKTLSCNYFRANPTHTPTVQSTSRTDGWTDRQTDQTDGRLTIAIPRFALRASRGKNEVSNIIPHLAPFKNVYNILFVVIALYIINRLISSV